VLAVLGGGVGSAVVLLALRAVGPLAGRFFGTLLKSRAELDADRDRIIAQLRAEINDWERRLKVANDRAKVAEDRAALAEERIAALEAFIDRFLARFGLDRASIDRGEAWPSAGGSSDG